jgi:hypothetical protein
MGRTELVQNRRGGFYGAAACGGGEVIKPSNNIRIFGYCVKKYMPFGGLTNLF